jgi:hypothetical protein
VLRLVYTRADGTETTEAEAPLDVLLPGDRIQITRTIEMPLDPVRLRAEIVNNPGDADPSNDSQVCFFGARSPQAFTCAAVESTHESRNLLVELGWENPTHFDEILLRRDGQVIASLPGTATRFVDAGAAPGLHEYDIRSRVGVSRSSRASVLCQLGPIDGASFRRGDVDLNGALQITDAIKVLGYLFLGSAEPVCQDAADADDNGSLQITDAIRILGYLFVGSAAPPFPGPDQCGPDPSDDALPACGSSCQ